MITGAHYYYYYKERIRDPRKEFQGFMATRLAQTLRATRRPMIKEGQFVELVDKGGFGIGTKVGVSLCSKNYLPEGHISKVTLVAVGTGGVIGYLCGELPGRQWGHKRPLVEGTIGQMIPDYWEVSASPLDQISLLPFFINPQFRSSGEHGSIGLPTILASAFGVLAFACGVERLRIVLWGAGEKLRKHLHQTYGIENTTRSTYVLAEGNATGKIGFQAFHRTAGCLPR